MKEKPEVCVQTWLAVYIEQWGCCSHLAAVWHRCFLRKPTWHRPHYKTGSQTGFLKYRASWRILHTGPFTSALHLKQLLQSIAISKTLLSLFSDGHAIETSRGCQLHRVARERRPQSAETLKTLRISSEPSWKRVSADFFSVVPGGEVGSLGDYKPSETRPEVSLCVRLGRRPLSFPSLLRRRTPRLVLLGRYETRPL